MDTFPNNPFLRQALLVDAAVSGATALLMTELSATVSSLTDLPAALLFWVGLSMAPYIAFLVFLATRDELPAWPVKAVVAMNFAWAALCAGLLVSRATGANAFGVAFVLVQAVAVILFAELQLIALRRSAPAQRYA